MASSTSWEVVKTTKKAKGSPQSLSKNQKKTFVSRMARIEVNAPLEPDQTIYTAAFQRDQDQGPKKNGSVPASNANNNKKAATQKKKKPDQDIKKPEKPLPADAAIAEIDHLELSSILSQSQIRFPDNQDVWLKDLASFLNFKLEKVKDFDPAFKGKPQGYPFSKLSSGCQKVLNSVVKKFSTQALDHLFYHSIQSMLQEASKDQSTLGYKIFLQLLAQHKPDITLGKVHQYLDLLKTHQNRPANCLSILWAVGACGTSSFKCGLKVWLDLMLPALEVRQVAHYPVDYLEALLSSHKKATAYGVVTLKEYFKVVDVVFSPGFNLSVDLRKRLVALYPNIRELAYGDSPSHNLRTFFPTYLTRLNSATNQSIKNELLSCLVECLMVDQQSFSVWCTLYTKNMQASGLLLEHITSNWSKLAPKINKKLMRETVRSFCVTNEEMEGRGSNLGFTLCQAATKELEAKMTGSSFPWGLLLFSLVSLVSAIVVYDVMSSPSLRKSRTMRFLEHYGVLTVLEQAWGRVHTFLGLAANWVQVNCPVYYTYLCDTVGPALLATWANLKTLIIQAEASSRPHRAWAVEKAGDAYLWVYNLSPDTWVWAREMAWLSCEVLRDYSMWIWTHSLHLAKDTHHYVTENLLTGSLSTKSIQASLSVVWANAQTALAHVWDWCDHNILSQITQMK